jgi:isopentenyl diphosphate isomerase/L-lactate dehydrogenase-like FMN-dependent dehydrogenase
MTHATPNFGDFQLEIYLRGLSGVLMMASTLSVDPLESVAAQFGDTLGFFQLYPPSDRELAKSFVSR